MSKISQDLAFYTALWFILPDAPRSALDKYRDRLPCFFKGFRAGVSHIRLVTLPDGMMMFRAADQPRSPLVYFTRLTIDGECAIRAAYHRESDILYIAREPNEKR